MLLIKEQHGAPPDRSDVKEEAERWLKRERR